MMGEPKAFASLSAGLLARKGGARPAMRRQPSGGGAAGSLAAGGLGFNAQLAMQDDLGWNDMGYDPDPARDVQGPALDVKALLPGSVMMPSDHGLLDTDLRGAQPVPEVLRQQAALRERLLLPAADEADEADAADEADVAISAGGLDRAAREGGAPVRKAKRERKMGAQPREVAAQVTAAIGKSAVRARDKAAFTLRLDADQHLRLRLASAVSNRSSQGILIALLDEYLASLPEIGDLAGRVPAAPPARIARAR